MSLLRMLRRGFAVALVVAIGACNKESSPTAPSPSVPTSPAPIASCASSVSEAPAVALATSGAEFAVSVTAASGCAWTAASNSPFIVAAGSNAGIGSGSASFAVQPNDGAPRQGSVQVAGRDLAVVQSGTVTAACAFAITPTDRTMSPAAGEFTVTIAVTSGADCAWTTHSQSPFFLTISSSATGIGPATVTLALAANTGPARVGTATLAGRTFMVLQETTATSSCVLSVTPQTGSLGPAGGGVVVNVTKTQGDVCAWIAQPQSPFLTIPGSSSGLNNGSVTVVVGPNGGPARNGSVIVAGRTVSISQGGAVQTCALSILPTASTPSSVGGDVFTIVSKTQGTACPWTAQPQSPFITILNGSSGIDTGTVVMRVEPNTGTSRLGTVLVAGRTFTVTQSGPSTPCAFRVAPADISAGAAQSSTMVYITQTGGENCAWSAQTGGASHIRVDPSSGVISSLGYANAMVFVDTNTGPARNATVTFGNAALSIAQAGTLPSSAAAVLTFESDPTDSVGLGQSRSSTFTGSQFEVSANPADGSLTFDTAFLANPSMHLRLAAPTGQPLSAGSYPITQRFEAAGVAGVDFGYSGRGCNTSTGRLLVQEATYGAGNTVQRFHARFEQHCGNSSAALRGTIWIDAAGSTTPPALAPFPSPGAGTTFFSYQSEPGDVIGGGSGSFTLANAVFTPTTADSREVVIAVRSQPAGASSWNLLFNAGTGAPPLAGTFDPTTDPAAPGAARVRVQGPGSCSGSSSRASSPCSKPCMVPATPSCASARRSRSGAARPPPRCAARCESSPIRGGSWSGGVRPPGLTPTSGP